MQVQPNPDYLYENSLIDVKSDDNNWTVCRIRKITPSELEIVLDGWPGSSTIPISGTRIAPFRKFTSLYTGPNPSQRSWTYSQDELKTQKTKLEHILNQGFYKLSAYEIVQYLRGELGIFIENLIQWDYSNDGESVNKVIQYFELVLQMVVNYFKCFLGLFGYYEELGKTPEQFLASSAHALASAYLDVMDITEKLLSLQPRCRNLFSIKESFLPEFELSNKLRDKPEYSSLFLHLLDYFVNNEGFSSIINLLSYRYENYGCPVILFNKTFLHIFEDFLNPDVFKILNEQLISGLVNRLRYLTEKDIKQLDMENVQRLFNRAFPDGLTEDIEEFLIRINCVLIKCPFLEKRLRGLNGVIGFIEKIEKKVGENEIENMEKKAVENERIALILAEEELVKDLLEARPHIELYKRVYPVFKVMSQNNMIKDKECEIIMNLILKGNKTEVEAGYKIIEEICEYIDENLQMQLYNKLQSFPPETINLMVLSEFSLKIAEKCGKICILDYLMACIQDTSTFLRTKEALDCIKKIFTHKLGQLSAQTFLQSLPEKLLSQVSIPQYLQISIEALTKFESDDLISFCTQYQLKQKIISNLISYQESSENQIQSKYSHKEQISYRLKFLEFILNQTQFKVYLKTKEISSLWEILVKNPKDPGDSEIFLMHLSVGTFKGPLINDNEKIFREFFLNEKRFGYKKLSIREFNAFKQFFFKANSNSAFIVSENQLKCVRSENVLGLDKMIDIFLNSEGLTIRACMRVLLTLFTVYSEEVENEMSKLFDQHLGLFLYKIDVVDDNCVNRALQFLTILLDVDKVYESLHKFLIWDGVNSVYILLPLASSVRNIRKTISKAINQPLCQVNFKIGDTCYTHLNDLYDIKLKSDNYIEFVPANNGVIELDAGEKLSNSEVLTEFLFKKLLRVKEMQEKTWKFTKQIPVRQEFQQVLFELNENLALPEDPFELFHCFTLFSQYKNEETWLNRFKDSQVARNFINFYLTNQQSADFLIIQEELLIEILTIIPVQGNLVNKILLASLGILYKSFGRISELENSKVFFENIEKVMSNYSIDHLKNLKSLVQTHILQIIQELIKHLLNLTCKTRVYNSLEKLVLSLVNFSEYQSHIIKYFTDDSILNTAINDTKHKFFWKFLLKIVKNRSLTLEDLNFLMGVFNTYLDNLSESSTDCNNPLKFILKILKNINILIGTYNTSSEAILKIFQEYLCGSTDNLPLSKCKNRSTRAAAYRYLLSLTTESTLSDIFPYLEAFSNTLAWRSSKNWSITFNTREKSSIFTGIRNLGSTCYMNSLFQQLNSITHFSSSFLSLNPTDPSSTIFQVKKLFTKLQYLNTPFVSTKSFCSNFKDYDDRPVNPVEQMDADEFFCRLMDKLENELKGTESKVFIQEFFGLSTAIEMISECGHKSERQEMMLNVPIEVKNKKDLEASLNTMVQGEIMQGDNAYFCEQCQGKVKSQRRTSFKYLPNFLVFSLRRFEFNYDFMVRFKLNDQFEFPSELNMKEFTTEYLNNEQTAADQYYLYSLKGIVVHYGRAEQGHYYSFIKIEDHWFEFNDTLVSEVKEETVKLKAFGRSDAGVVPSAYLLIYERKVKFGYFDKSREKIWQSPERNVDVAYVEGKNTKNWFKKMVLSQDYLKFQIALEKKQVPVKYTVDYFLTALLRIDRNFAQKFRLIEQIISKLDSDTAIYILEILSSEQGKIEFLFTNNNFIARKLVFHLCKACIPMIPPSALPTYFYNFLSSFQNLYKYSIVSQYLDILYLFAQSLINESVSINFPEQIIRYLTDSELNLSIPAKESTYLGYTNQYKHKIYLLNDQLNTSKTSAFYMLRLFIPYLPSSQLTYLCLDETRNLMYKKCNSMESLRAFGYLYQSLYYNDLDQSCTFIYYILNILQESPDSRNSILSLFYLFIENHQYQEDILKHVLDYFLSIIPTNNLDQLDCYLNYLGKVAKGLNIDQLVSKEKLEELRPKMPENPEFNQNQAFMNKFQSVCEKLDNLQQMEINPLDTDHGFPLGFSEPGHSIFIFDSGRKNWFNGIVKKRLYEDLVLVEYVCQNSLDLCIKSLKSDDVYPKLN